MPFLDATIYKTLQQKGVYIDQHRPELGIAKAMPSVTKQANFIMPSVKKELEKISSARGIEIAHLKDGGPTVHSVPSFDIPASLRKTGVTSMTTYDIAFGFKVPVDLYENNVADAESYVYDQITQGCYNSAKKLEEILLQEFLGQKTTKLDHTVRLNAGDGTYTFDSGLDALTITKDAQNDTMLYKLSNLMTSNEVGGNYHFIGAPLSLAEFNAQTMKYGAGNDKNLAWGQNYLPIENRHSTDSIGVTEGTNRWEAYMIREGEMAVIPNFPKAFRDGRTVGTKQWGRTSIMPFINMPANVFTNTEAADTSNMMGTNDSNGIMSSVEEQQYWFRFHVLKRPNTSADGEIKPTGLVKINGLLV